MLQRVSDKLDNDGVPGALQSTLLDQKTGATDGSGHAVKKERISGGRRCIEQLYYVDRVLVFDKGPGLFGPQLHMSAFGDACPVNPRVIGGFADCVLMGAVEEVERHRMLFVDNLRRT